MKALMRVAAVLSFASFLAGGLLILILAARSLGNSDTPMLVVVGLFLLGVAFFVGPTLLAAAERFG